MPLRRHRPRSRALASALTAAAIAIGVVSALPATAWADAPEGPAGLDAGGDVAAGFPVLSWRSVAGAVSYEVQVDDDPTFGSTLLSVTTTNVAYAWSQAVPPGTQHWRVRAVDAAKAASPWTQSTMEIPRTAAPRPLSPTDADVLAQPDDPPLLEWSVVPGATRYVVQLDDEPGFVGSTEYSTAASSFVVPVPLSPVNPYYWRVKAVRGTGIESAFSDALSFTLGPLAVPEVVSPDSSPTNDLTDVVLDWQPVPGARYYDLEVSTDDDFATSTIVDKQSRVTGTRYSPKITYDNNQYFWRVRAVSSDEAVKSDWSPGVNQFRRSWTERPSLVHPRSDRPVSDPFYYQWTPVRHATVYQLQTSTSPQFDADVTLCLTAGTTYTPGTFPTNDPLAQIRSQDVGRCAPRIGVTTYWRVRAFDRPYQTSGVQGLFSPTHAFQYRPRDFVDQTATTRFSPAPGATVAVPTITWSPDLDADTYVVKIFKSAGTQVDSVTTRATSWTPTKELRPADGPFTWSIQAVEADGEPGSLIYSQQFRTGGAPDTSAAPLTATSGDGTTSRRAPALAWVPHPDAAYYRLRTYVPGTDLLAPGDTELASTKLPYPAATYAGKAFLERGDYEWQVTAYDAGDRVVARGALHLFHVAALDAVTGQRLAVSGSGVADGRGCGATIGTQVEACAELPTTPTLAWSPVADASYYMVYVSQDDKFTNLLELAGTTGTRWTPSAGARFPQMPESQAGASYYWFVRPCKTAGVCGSASPISVTPSVATNMFRKKSPGITGGSTTAGTGDGSEVTFTWDDYHDTNLATAWPTAGDPAGATSDQTAQTYHLEVSTTAAFTTLLESADVDQPTFTSFTRLYPDGPVHWRVRAVDAADNDLAWSPTYTWNKAGPAVRPSSPVDLEQISASVPLRWEARAYAQKYEVQVAENDDANFSRDNVLFTEQTTQTAYTWTRAVPVSPAPYVWRVRRLDSVGNPGAWSAARRFVNPSLPPTLLTPAADANVGASRGRFTWTFVPGATSYRVEVQTGTATASWTTTGNAYAPAAAYSNGVRRWRVIALDAARDVVGTSEWRTFRVEAPGVVTPPALHGTARVGGELRVTAPTFDPSAEVTSYQWFRSVAATTTPAAIPGATGVAYVVQPADAGAHLTVRATGRTDGFPDATATSDALLVTLGDAPVATSGPTVTGEARVGELLGVTRGAWPGMPALTYRWFRDGAPVASGATYRLSSSDLGRRVHVVETASVPGYLAGTAASEAVVPVTGFAPALTAAPTLTPAAVTVGDTLSATTGTWSPSSGNAYAYQWHRDGAPLDGATAATYRVTGDDVGHPIHVVVTATASGRAVGTTASGAVVPNGAVIVQSRPTITGDPIAGRVVTADPGTWSAPAELRYQWFVDGVATSPAPTSSPTFTLRPTDVGRRVHVRVRATATGYLEGTADSDPVVVASEGPLVAVTPPRISGSARSGGVLTASPGTWPTAVHHTYQWFRGTTPIAGATRATYIASVADAGRPLAVRVTASAPAWDAGAATSAVVMIARAVSSTTIGLSSARVTVRQRGSATITVKVPGLAAPGGTVTVYDGSRRLATMRLAGSKVTYRLPRLAAGVHTVRAVYSGTAQVAPSSRTARLAVTR